jgi:dihydrolipoamide dehydrogenase
MNVALVERDALGGTCLNRGCIPAKAFLETASVFRHVAHAADFGIEASAPAVNFATTQARKAKIVDGLVKGIGGLCKSRKVTVFNGTGSLGANRTVNITMADGSTATAQGASVILAAGSVPRTIPGFDRGGPIMTSDEVLIASLSLVVARSDVNLPRRLLILVPQSPFWKVFPKFFPVSTPTLPMLW